VKKGFTLIEMMMVIMVIAILAGIISAKIGNLLDKSKDSYTKGQLTTMRSTLNIYYSDNNSYPKDNLNSLIPKYIPKIPTVKLINTNHPENNYVKIASDINTAIDDTGGWAYINDETSGTFGKILINCTHMDLKGNVWSSY